MNGPQYKCLSTSESVVPWWSITQLGRNLFFILMDCGHILPCNQFSCVPAHTTFCDIYFFFLTLFKELSSLRRSGRAFILRSFAHLCRFIFSEVTHICLNNNEFKEFTYSHLDYFPISSHFVDFLFVEPIANLNTKAAVTFSFPNLHAIIQIRNSIDYFTSMTTEKATRIKCELEKLMSD